MSIAERIKFARLAYVRAVALARARSDPASWARLLTAARNLKQALQERERHDPDPRPVGA